MKKLVNITEVEGEGLVALMGQRVLLMCLNYFYAGELVGVNDKFVQLKDASVVYETGEWSAKQWKDAQRIGEAGSVWYVQTAAIEAYGAAK